MVLISRRCCPLSCSSRAGYGALHLHDRRARRRRTAARCPPLTDEERALAASLKRHIETIAAREHNVAHYDELEKAGALHRGDAGVASAIPSAGRNSSLDGKPVRNIDATIEPRADASDPEVIVVGAHYDSARGHARRQRQRQRRGGGPRARAAPARSRRQTASASASCCSSTRSRPISRPRPWAACTTPRALAARNERVVAMYSLETIGFYSSEPGSQRYPAPFGLMFPDRGDFVAFVGTPWARGRWCWETIRSFRSHTAVSHRSAASRPAPSRASTGRTIGRSPSRASRP